ncbi:DEAD/DEAH box helicase family protein [Pseudescherichia vulneris]|uniref:DEAD/DEAH box helicase family protein n=1 Tax=Pseudescherichia vulneris TaxID=566 RepID=UPI0028ABCC84|nr:DEAD/DEAH box helicase family protein [Pseudescherichia vulneris]
MSIYQNNKLKFISGEPGTGKGVHIKTEIFNSPHKRFLIVQPTKELIDEFSKDILDAVIIHTGTHGSDLLTEINKQLSSTKPCVMFITDKMYYRIDLYRLMGWTIFIDDCVDFCNVISRNKSTQDNIEAVYEKMFITGDYIEIEGEGGELDHMYLTYDLCPIENISQDLQDAWKHYKQLDMYHRKGIYKESLNLKYNKVILWGDYDIAQYTDRQYNLDITYLANNFEQTLLYKANKEKFVQVHYNKTFKENNNSRIVMNYFMKDEKFGLSKSIMKNQKATIDKIEKYITDNVSNYYWTINNDEEITFSLSGKKIGCNQRGINTLMDYTSAVFMAAMNPSDVVVPHYNNLWGLDSTDLVNQWTYETLNQFVYRGIVRNYNSDEAMNVYVFDEVTAHTIQGANYNYIDLGLTKLRKEAGRPKGTLKGDKVLATRFANFKARNKNKPDFKKRFYDWRNEQEQYADQHGLEWLDQLDYYQNVLSFKP